jgi:16S rRNA (adenine1518-N6/adenine1519-N6)-dimethyltransferase
VKRVQADGGPGFDPATAPLTSPAVIHGLLDRFGLRPDQRFGQHFLIAGNVIASVIAAAGVRAEDEVWEVGPGLGVLTRALSAAARTVVSIELDARLLPILRATLAHAPNVTIVADDALTVDLDRVPQGSRFAANLPYNVGTAVLARVLASNRFSRLGVLLQREVAERLVAAPGSRAYGSLSLLVAHFGTARIARRVPPDAFLPPPAVTSAVVSITVRPDVRPDPRTFALVRAGFRHRRKTLLANLRLAGVDAADAQAALEAVGLAGQVRAETLDLATFRALAAELPALDVQSGMHT